MNRSSRRRGWIFTWRYYSPGGWRVPRFVYNHCWQYNASGKSASFQLSYLHGFPQACRRFWRLLRSDVTCAVCLHAERPWRRMMWFPFGFRPSGAYVCSGGCWDVLEARRAGDEERG